MKKVVGSAGLPTYELYCGLKNWKRKGMDMVNLEERLFEKLKKYERVNALLGDMLKNRVKHDDWIENPLIQIILKESRPNIDLVDEMITGVYRLSESLFNQLKSVLIGTEREFDTQIGDLFAEINAINWLKNAGFTEIERIERSETKTPDFRAIKGNSYIAEVKNFRTPTYISDIIFGKLEAAHLQRPDIYDGKFFQVGISPDYSIDDRVRAGDKKGIINLIEKIEENILGKKDEYLCQYTFKEKNIKFERTIHIKWKTGDYFSIMGPMRQHALNLSDPKLITDLLFPLVRKTWNKVGTAVDQLLSYDVADEFEKLVLINWQKTPHFIFIRELDHKFAGIIEQIDAIIQEINMKTHILIM